MPIKSYTDIADRGWITMLPPRWRPFALIARLDRPIGAWLLFLPGLWAILLTRRPDTVSARLIVLFGIGAVLMRAAGCIVNDIWDRELDRRVARTANRPLAAGTLTVNGAMIFLVALLLLSLGILMSLGHLAQLLGAVSLILVALYPLAKRVTSWPQLVLGLTFGWGVPLGAAAASGRLNLAVLSLYCGTIAWILGYDTIYAHQDREDDAMVGVGSTALALGRYTKPFLVLCYTATIALTAVAGTLAGSERWFYVALAFPAVLLARQVMLARHRRSRSVPRVVQVESRGRSGGRGRDPRRLAVIDAARFLDANTRPSRTVLVPEILLHLAVEITPVWRATEHLLDRENIDPPYWAFAWPGGQALARHVLDYPALVAGRTVLDFAAGCGIAAIACAMAGARQVDATEIDPLAIAAIRRNAAANSAEVTTVQADLVGAACRWDIILCGDVCYEAPMTDHIMPWLRGLADQAEVWLADPGRAYLPAAGREELARYRVPTTLELEDRLERHVGIYRLNGTSAPH